MNIRSSALVTAALLTLGTAALAPVTAAASPQVGVTIVIGDPPPPPRYERIPPPRHGYIWSPGYWDWRSHRHVWVGGNWVAVRPGYVYSQPHWVQRDGRWYREAARWNRGPHGDRDRDGIPNRYDHYDNRGYARPGPRHEPQHHYNPGNHYGHDKRGDHRGHGGRGDNDRDGVPNRYDRDRDGDGVPNRHDRRPDNPRRD